MRSLKFGMVLRVRREAMAKIDKALIGACIETFDEPAVNGLQEGIGL
jgi:hypothetical protein